MKHPHTDGGAESGRFSGLLRGMLILIAELQPTDLQGSAAATVIGAIIHHQRQRTKYREIENETTPDLRISIFTPIIMNKSKRIQ